MNAFSGERKRIWGNVVPLLLGYFIERDPYSRDYHLHSGSNLLNELTDYGEFDLFGGNDLAALHAGLSIKMASDSHLLPWLFYYWGLVRHITGSKFTMPYAGSYY